MGFFVITVLVVGVGYLLLRRWSASAPASPAAGPQTFLLEIEIPLGRPACAAALALRGRRFAKADAPAVPLAECAARDECRCRYRSLPERRVVIRRAGADRRQGIRFDPENPPRRGGPGRRIQDRVSWIWRG